MAVYRAIPRPRGLPEAELGFVMDDDTMEPWIKRGSRVWAVRPGTLEPGEVGVFAYKGRALCRQYAEDSEGNIYLLPLNRRRASQDLTVPPTEDVWYLAKVILKDTPPLPGIE